MIGAGIQALGLGQAPDFHGWGFAWVADQVKGTSRRPPMENGSINVRINDKIMVNTEEKDSGLVLTAAC